MGLIDNSSTLVAPQPKGIIDPNTGKLIGQDDAFFGELNSELSDKGFFEANTEKWKLTGKLVLPKDMK